MYMTFGVVSFWGSIYLRQHLNVIDWLYVVVVIVRVYFAMYLLLSNLMNMRADHLVRDSCEILLVKSLEEQQGRSLLFAVGVTYAGFV